MRSRWRWWVVAVLLAFGSRQASAVTLNKCCDIGMVLHPDASCKTDIYNGEEWFPLITEPRPGGGFQSTVVPDNWTISAGTRPVCNNGKLPTLIHSPPESPSVFILLDNDSILLLMMHPSSDDSPLIFAPDAFCVDKHFALICDAPSQEGIRKCCGRNAAYSETNASCVHGEHFNSDEINIASASGFPVCHNVPSGIYIVAREFEGNLTAVVDKENNSLQLAPPPSPPLRVDEYCIERLVERPQRFISVFVCAPPQPERPAWPSEHESDLRFTLYPAGLAISAFFLAATLATGCLLPKAHHALHWRCQTCHVACLLVGDVLLASVQLAGAALPPGACLTMAVMMHFFFLAAFFWLNAMCFNIWWTFRDLRPMSAEPGQERFRYRAYSVYAWGVPLIIAGLGLLLDSLPAIEDEFTAGLLRPRFGERRCWFYGDLEIFTFFHGPVGVLLLLNLALFAATTRELTCGLWRREGVKSAGGGGSGGGAASSERSTLGRVCLKLVVVMGVSWIADIVSWAVGGPAYVWYITDLINALQGVLIFIVVGCQPQVWAAVKRLWWCSRGAGPTQGSTGANPMSCSSQGVPSTVAVEPSSPAPQATTSTVPPLETTC